MPCRRPSTNHPPSQTTMSIERRDARVLLVDDDEANRYTISRLLERAGYSVVQAATGADALQVARQQPDLVLLDVQLPDISGLEICRRLRSDPETQRIPVLQISANFTLTTDRIRGLDAGADGYLASPVEPEELLAHVRMLLRLKQAQDALHEHVTRLEATKKELADARDLLSHQNEILEARVHERTAKLMDTIQDLETFSYSITHDMRAPLRAMQGFSRLLLENYEEKLDAEGVQFLERICSSANRLDLLIRDVLSYSNIVRTKLRLVPINLQFLVTEILKDYPGFQPPAAHVEIKGTLPHVMGNEAFLTQVFSNLIGNAVKFVAKGVTPHVVISSETIEKMARLTITDNGIGIPPHHQTRLFGLFQRAQTKYPGTGIGLAVVKKAMERLGGRVGVISKAGHGSTFWFELPLAMAP